MEDDLTFTEKEMDRLVALCERLAKNRKPDIAARTMLQCATCKRGVQNQHSVAGMCPTCGEEEVTRLRGIETALLDGKTRADTVKAYRIRAKGAYWQHTVGRMWNAIADALEADA